MSQDRDTRPPTDPPPLPGEEVSGPPPLPAPGRPFPTTWLGGVLLGLGAFLAWLVAAQIVPSIVVVIGAGISEGRALTTEKEATEALLAHLPAFLFLGAVVSAALVAGAHALGWLAPAPKSARSLRAKAAWTVGALAACIGGSVVIGLLLDTVGHEVKEQEILVEAAASGGILFVLAGVLAAPIGEELGFRRLLFSTVRRGAGRRTAYILSTVLFALVHGNPSAFPLYLWMALWFTIAYEVTGSVWAAALVHGANNLVSLLAAP